MAYDLTPSQLDTLVRTVLGEAEGEGPVGMQAVASVIKNRADSGAFGSSDPAAIALQPYQFSAWNRGQGGNSIPRTANPNSKIYKTALDAVNGVFGGNVPDPTGGALYYHAVGTTPTDWPAVTQTAAIGNHVFFADPSHPVPPANVPNAPNSSGSPDDREPFAPLPLVPPDPFLARALQGGLTPSSSDVSSLYAGILPSANSSGSPDDRSSIVPQPVASQSAPAPLPLPSFAAPVVDQQPNLVRLSSGKMIAPGVYGTSVVSDDGNGNAVVTTTRSPLAAGPGTIVGGVANNAIKQTVVPQIANAVSGAQAGLSNLQSQAGNLLGGLGSAASGLLGNLFKPIPSVSAAVASPNSSGSPDDRGGVIPTPVTNPFAPPPLVPPGSYTPSNPNWTGSNVSRETAPVPYPTPSFAAPTLGAPPMPYPLPSFAAPMVGQSAPMVFPEPSFAAPQVSSSIVPQIVHSASIYSPPSQSASNGLVHGQTPNEYGNILDPNGSGRWVSANSV